MLHILLIHEQFLRPGGAGGSRHNEFVKLWRDAGHDVTVVAGMTSYTSGDKPADYRGRWIVEEMTPEGARVIRTFTFGRGSRGFAARVLGYGAFALSASTAVLGCVRGVDLVIATSPSLFVAVPGVLAARARRVPFVFEVRDLWPEFAIQMGALRGRWAIRMARALEAFAYRSADMIACLTPAFTRRLAEQGVPRGKLRVLPNGPDVVAFSPGPRDNDVRRLYNWGDRIVAVYTGAHGRANALGQVLDAAEILSGDKNILFVLVGGGEEKATLVADASRRRLENVQFLDEHPKADLPDIVRAADICLAVLGNIKGFETVYPNKVFDAMACARPVIVAVPGVISDLVTRAEAGVAVPPEDPRALAEAVHRLSVEEALRRAMGERGRSLVEREHNRETIAAGYLALLVDLAAGRVLPEIALAEA